MNRSKLFFLDKRHDYCQISEVKIINRILFLILLMLASSTLYSQQLTESDSNVDTSNQKDLIDVVRSTLKITSKNIKRVRGKKFYFSFLPTTSPIPGGGKFLFTSTSAAFYLGPRKKTNISSVYFSPYLNFKGRYSLSFRSNIFTSNNLWNIQGDTRLSLFPEYIFGAKSNGQENNKILINYKYIRFYQTVLKKVKPYLLAGVGYNLDYHINISTVNDSIGFQKFTNYPHGTGENSNSFSSGVTANILYDSRNNSLNPLPGAYLNLIYRVNPYFLGNGSNGWQSIYLDSRKYISLPGKKRHLVALWNYIWTALSNGVPYLDLPGIGYEPYQRSGRGIEQNRYRGKSLIYLEGEYRSDITNNGLFGYVVFANLNTVASPVNSQFSGLHPAAGAGLRIKFNKRSNTNIAIDFGVSKGNFGYSLNLGEAF